MFKLYELYDETDIEHCIIIENKRTLKEIIEAAKTYKEKFPYSIVKIYEVVITSGE